MIRLAVIAPCELPRNPNGDYTAGYRAGLTIANGSMVDYTCNEPEYYKISQGPVQCLLGELVPDFPSCKSRQDRFGAEGNDPLQSNNNYKQINPILPPHIQLKCCASPRHV